LNRAFEFVFILSEILLIIAYLFCTEYGSGVHPAASSVLEDLEARDFVQGYYPMFQDVHVMIFIGFGFLMVFLKTHSWSSVGFNFIIAAYALQLTILVTAFWHMALGDKGFHKIPLDITSLILGDFGAGCVLITFGAVLGKVSLFQMWMLATLEIVFYGLNETICAEHFMAVDMGGSMYVHTFGAYFGLAAAYFFHPKTARKDEHNRCGGDYNSQLIAMIGTIFLWMYWPSFNGALAGPTQQQRVIVNTVLAISASCIGAIGVSRIVLQKLDMEVLLNATLAGGVAVGSASDLVVTAGVAMLIGCAAGIISALGFLYLNKFLQQNINLHDTCGVHNLHGIPGIMGGVIGAISASLSESTFGDDATLGETFPAIKDGRTVSEQGWMQLAALGVSLTISILGGIISGFLVSRCANPEKYFDDQEHFHECDYEVDTIEVTEMHVVGGESLAVDGKVPTD
jgi:ammonium transporter Rh